MLLSLSLCFVVLYLAVALGMQRRLLFPAPGEPWDELTAGVEGLERWQEGLYLPPPENAQRPAPALIFAHGNGELADFWAKPFEEVRSWGFAVFLVEYPGYDRTEGSPSEESITETLIAAYDALGSRPEVDASRIIGHGRSLGGGAICGLAARRELAALVLQSTFTGIRPLARGMLLPGFLVLDPFDNLEVVRNFPGPVLILHGERDTLIPPSHAQKLHAAAKDSTLHWFPSGHNDSPLPWPWMKPFLEEQGLLR